MVSFIRLLSGLWKYMLVEGLRAQFCVFGFVLGVMLLFWSRSSIFWIVFFYLR